MPVDNFDKDADTVLYLFCSRKTALPADAEYYPQDLANKARFLLIQAIYF